MSDVEDGDVDARSVGELLLDAEHLSRQLLLEVTGERAESLIWTWGEVVEAAGQLWDAIPSPAPGATADPMQRLQHVSRSAQRQIRGDRRTAPPADTQLDQIASTFIWATDLVASHAVPPVSEAARADVEAARLRIMHTLYVATHGVIVAVREHLEDLRQQAHEDNVAHRGEPLGAVLAQQRISRLGVVERLAGACVDGHYVKALAGEATPAPALGHQRLADALTGWDIQLHRTLAVHQDAQTLSIVSRTQADVATATAVLLGAAASTGHLAAEDYQRLSLALAGSQRAWMQAGIRWADLIELGKQPLDPKLFSAANELRAAAREITHDRTSWAEPNLIAQRVDLYALLPGLGQSLAAAPAAAAACREAAVQPVLQGPARPMAARIRAQLNRDEDNAGPTAVENPTAAISPAAIASNRVVAAPQPLRNALLEVGDRTLATSTQAASAAEAAGLMSRPSPMSVTAKIGQDAERRTLVFPGHVPWHPPGPSR